MQSIQAYLDRKALSAQLSVRSLSLNAAQPTKSMRLHENFPIQPSRPYGESRVSNFTSLPENRDTEPSSTQNNPEVTEILHLENALRYEADAQGVGMGLDQLILNKMTAQGVTDPTQVRRFLTDEAIEDVLNERAHVLLTKFNSHITEITRTVAESMASMNKLYDNKVELLSAAFEADFARLSNLFAGLNKRLEDLKAVSGVLPKDDFTAFLQRYKQQDEIPSIIEERMLIMARCVQNRVSSLRTSFEEQHIEMKHVIAAATSSIKSYLDLSCPKCFERYGPSRRIIALAPCGHSICESCFYNLSGQVYMGQVVVLTAKRAVCSLCNSLISHAVLDRMMNARVSRHELDPREAYQAIAETLTQVHKTLMQIDVLNPDAIPQNSLEAQTDTSG
ncbi:zinc-RING finger domain-containing protein [Giardia duodenalis]|uniref:Zinc-RING finger domain-containing protein n=1 Tax=Giardia intestinalis (strain ATCC 50803 / WB clone C6) TaxID=184922 RepID=A8BW81_GIAIC|nr:zinc-RING finger domain-containing protein [Giardia intestinalis]KAE8306033.1 zinc-RING finger domain-containing protein [Giardia intestinalis]|eukprot:XP_001704457.1 Hypothetical protein GL50803_21398 [Giardia lamblia ATCC 50803]